MSDKPEGTKQLEQLIRGINPSTGRRFSPESMRRKQRAEDMAIEVRDDVVGPLREWAESLSNLVSEVERALDDLEGSAGDLESAETGDDREDAYQEMDEALNSTATALEDLLDEIK